MLLQSRFHLFLDVSAYLKAFILAAIYRVFVLSVEFGLIHRGIAARKYLIQALPGMLIHYDPYRN